MRVGNMSDNTNDDEYVGTLTFKIKRPVRFSNTDAEIKSQRDELLALLKEVDSALEKAWNGGRLPRGVISGDLVKSYRAVIAKCEGK